MEATNLDLERHEVITPGAGDLAHPGYVTVTNADGGSVTVTDMVGNSITITLAKNEWWPVKVAKVTAAGANVVVVVGSDKSQR